MTPIHRPNCPGKVEKVSTIVSKGTATATTHRTTRYSYYQGAAPLYQANSDRSSTIKTQLAEILCPPDAIPLPTRSGPDLGMFIFALLITVVSILAIIFFFWLRGVTRTDNAHGQQITDFALNAGTIIIGIMGLLALFSVVSSILSVPKEVAKRKAKYAADMESYEKYKRAAIKWDKSYYCPFCECVYSEGSSFASLKTREQFLHFLYDEP